VACRPDRLRSDYTIDFGGRECFRYIPELRHLVRIENGEIVSLRGRIPLNRVQTAFLRELDGQRTISDIIARLIASGVLVKVNDPEEFARDLFRSMWRLGLVAFRLNRIAGV
jgi:hypothetical protein